MMLTASPDRKLQYVTSNITSILAVTPSINDISDFSSKNGTIVYACIYCNCLFILVSDYKNLDVLDSWLERTKSNFENVTLHFGKLIGILFISQEILQKKEGRSSIIKIMLVIGRRITNRIHKNSV